MERVVVRGRPLPEAPLDSATRGLLQEVCRELGVSCVWHDVSHTLYIDSPLTGKTIVVDPGHGGPDRYQMGRSGLVEADFVDSVADRLQELLELAGAMVVRTRRGSVAVETARRIALVRQAEPWLAISLHLGNYRRSRGVSAYINWRRGLSGWRLARHILMGTADSTGLPVGGTRLRWHKGIGGEGYEVLDASRAPAVVLELGQLGSTEDEAILMKPGTSHRLAGGILQGILRYLRWCGKWYVENESGGSPIAVIPVPAPDGPPLAPPPPETSGAAVATPSAQPPMPGTLQPSLGGTMASALINGLLQNPQIVVAKPGPTPVIGSAAQAVRAGGVPPPPVLRFGSPPTGAVPSAAAATSPVSARSGTGQSSSVKGRAGGVPGTQAPMAGKKPFS